MFGLTPIFPIIWVPAVVDIPVLARITKLPAFPRSTGVAPYPLVMPSTIAITAIVITVMACRLTGFVDITLPLSLGHSVWPVWPVGGALSRPLFGGGTLLKVSFDC